MKRSDVIATWDVLRKDKDVGDIGFCDLEAAIQEMVGIENDIDSSQPEESKGETK